MCQQSLHREKSWNLLTNVKNVVSRWKEHLLHLLADEDKEKEKGAEEEESASEKDGGDVDIYKEIPAIVEDIEGTIKMLKNYKAPGEDELPAEFHKVAWEEVYKLYTT